MIDVCTSLRRQLQEFFDLRLHGVARWRAVKHRPDEWHDKERGRRQRKKGIVAVDFAQYALILHSTEEEPPLGKVVMFDSDRGKAFTGPLTISTWDEIAAYINQYPAKENSHVDG